LRGEVVNECEEKKLDVSVKYFGVIDDLR